MNRDSHRLPHLLSSPRFLLGLPLVALMGGFVFNLFTGVPYPGGADAAGYYAWQQTLLTDHDLDPANQLKVWNTTGFYPEVYLPALGRSVRFDKYPIGWSLTMLPATTVAAVVVHFTGWGTAAAPQPGAEAPFGYAVWMMIGLLGVGAVLLTHAMLRTWFDAHVSAVALVTAFFGSAALAYFTIEPFMAHAVSAFWLSAAMYAAVRYAGGGKSGWLLLTALAGGMLVLTRLLDGMLLFPALVIVLSGPALPGIGRRLTHLLAAGVLFLAVVSLQGFVDWRLYGSFFFNGYAAGGEHFLRTLNNFPPFLFSIRDHGFVLWHPALVLSTMGLLWGAARCDDAKLRWVCGAAAGSVVFTLVTYGFWWCWSLGASFAARWTADLLPIWAIGIAAGLVLFQRRGGTARRAMYCCSVAALVTFAGIMLQVAHAVLRGPQP